jgi:excinuclease ABC subunit C
MIPAGKYSTQDVPAQPGVYLFRNSAGDVIYVGKAKVLRKRLASYFQPSRRRSADIKLRSLIKSIAFFEMHPVRSEAEALLLESRLIKQYSPRYNVELRDDKRFLLLAIDLNEPFPRLTLTRLRKEDGRLYFGPFPQAGALRRTLHYLTRHFALRTCGVRVPDSRSREHCLETVMRRCCRPCEGKVGEEDYQQRVQRLLAVLRGNSKEVEEALTKDMQALATRQKYEEAARVRDILENVRYVCRVERMRSFQRARLPGASAGKPGVAALQEALGMKQPPEYVECFDISNIGGRLAVASMVCFRGGKPSTKDYRRFRIRFNDHDRPNDFAMMAEVIGRRYRRIMDEARPLPDLIVVDGGAGQVSAALKSLQVNNIPPVALLGLAKRHEEIWLPAHSIPIQLDRHNPGLKLLQAMRDEAHRFALNYHQKLRRRRIADSVLAEVSGIGPRRQEQLLKAFGSVARLRKASAQEVAEAVPGLSLKLAETLIGYLRTHSKGPH